jgi:hypothetical protein
VPWDCAAASTAWALNTISYQYTEAEVVAGLGSSRISPAYGLLDASGAGLVDWLAQIGVQAANNSNATWADVIAAAGSQPMVIGGRQWCHWSGVRISNVLWKPQGGVLLALANPAPGWGGVDQVMSEDDFNALGAFSAVWFQAW